VRLGLGASDRGYTDFREHVTAEVQRLRTHLQHFHKLGASA
jgi:hypothetical protein